MSAMPRMLLGILILGLGARGALHAAPGDPVGGEFQVNTYTTAAQFPTAVLPLRGVGFVVVWHGRSGIDSEYEVFAQWVDASGTPVGGEFQVNTYTTGQQGEAAVASTGTGGFVVVWESDGSSGSDTSERGILAQRYDAVGAPAGGEFQVNSYTTGAQFAPGVASTGADGFVVVWVSDGSTGTDTSERGILAQRYDGAGAPIGGEFQVNSFTTGTQDRPAVAPTIAGGFVVVWRGDYSSGTDDSGESVQARVFDAAGMPLNPDFQVNAFTTSSQGFARVFPSLDGFWVVWESDGGADGDGGSIQARRFDGTGTAPGDEFQVNTYTTSNQSAPSITTDGAGDFVVVWESGGSAGSDTSLGSIQARRYDPAGSPLGDQFQVNSYTTGNQYFAEVGPDGAGGFVVVWAGPGDGSDTSGVSVRAQRFTGPTTTTTSTLPPAHALEGRALELKAKPGRPKRSKLELDSRDRSLTLGRGNQSADDPVVHGGELRVTSGAGAFAATHGLVGSWKYVGKVGQNKGYRWESRGAIRSIDVRKRRLEVTGRGADIGFDLDDDPDPVRIELTIGALRYCLEFGGEAPKFKTGRLYRARRAPVPASCP